MQAIRSYEDAYEIAEQIIERMEEGQAIGLNAITLRKVSSYRVKVAGAEYTHEENQRYGREDHLESSGHFTSVELGEFILFPERKRVNDALTSGVVERQLEQSRDMKETTKGEMMAEYRERLITEYEVVAVLGNGWDKVVEAYQKRQTAKAVAQSRQLLTGTEHYVHAHTRRVPISSKI